MRHLLTERLRLDAVVPSDLNERYALMSDPDAVRLVYADRPLDDDVLARVVALS